MLTAMKYHNVLIHTGNTLSWKTTLQIKDRMHALSIKIMNVLISNMCPRINDYHKPRIKVQVPNTAQAIIRH